MFDLREALNELRPHLCNIWESQESNDPNTGRLIKNDVLRQSGARCSLVAESAKNSLKGQSPVRERTFSLVIETTLTVTSKMFFTDFSGAGIPSPTDRYGIDKESTVNPIVNRLDGGDSYTGVTEIKKLKRIDGNA